MAGGTVKLAAAAAALLAVLLGAAPAPAQVARPRGPTEQAGDQLAQTQDFIERRWLVLQLRLLMQKLTIDDFNRALPAEAQRLGTRGPTAQDWAALDADLTREIEEYIQRLETRVRSGQVNWPRDRPAAQYANASLILVETIRLEAKEAVAKRGDVLQPMLRASKLWNMQQGNQAQINFFAGRDEAVELAMRSIKVTPPRPAGR
jgi:hypothetical protein